MKSHCWFLVAALGSAALCAPASAQNVFVPNAKSFPCGGSPRAVGVGDLNGDGKADAVIANDMIPGTISALLGDGAGNLGAPAAFPASNNPSAVALGDLNGDGKLDAVVVNNTAPGRLTALLGNGAGGFAAPVSVVFVGTGTSLLLFDATADGKLDALVTNTATNSLLVFPGTGSGSFGVPLSHPCGSFPKQAALGDVNGDGKLDAVIANGTTPGFASVLLGTGAGFGAPTAYAAGNGPVSLALGDTNADGTLDAAVANFAENRVSLLRGTGGGTLVLVGFAHGGIHPKNLTTLDINKDGRADFATPSDTAPNGQVMLLRSNSAGLLEDAAGFAAQNNPLGIATGDFDADTIPDVLVSNYGATTCSLLRGTTKGTLSGSESYNSGAPVSSFAAGDLDGDGRVDLLASTTTGIVKMLSSEFGGFLRSGSASFAPDLSFAQRVTLSDLNLDGLLDLLVVPSSSNSFWVSMSSSGGFLSTSQVITQGACTDVVAGDFNGDGVPDVVVGHTLQVSTTVDTYLGTGTGTLVLLGGTPTSPSSQGPVFIQTPVDFNLDGKRDLIARYEFSEWTSLSGTGSGLLSAQKLMTLPTSSSGDVHFVQGVLTVLVAAIGSPSPLTTSQYNPQTGHWLTTSVQNGSSLGSSLRTCDLNGDSNVDGLMVGGGGVYVLTGVGPMSFAPTYLAATPNAMSSTLSAPLDVDGDGWLDAVLATQDPQHGIVVLRNQGNPTAALLPFGTGTPGCAGAIAVAGNSKPTVGNAQFALLAQNAPTLATVDFLISNAADLAGSDPFGLNLILHLNFFASTELYDLPATSDAAGSAVVPIAIPSSPVIAGLTYYAQLIAIEKPSDGQGCSPQSFYLTSSKGLKITIQP